jgi:hypothetical protein
MGDAELVFYDEVDQNIDLSHFMRWVRLLGFLLFLALFGSLRS